MGTNLTHYFGLYRKGIWTYDNRYTDNIPSSNDYNDIIMTGLYRIEPAKEGVINAPFGIRYGFLYVNNLLNDNDCIQFCISTYISNTYPYAFAVRIKANGNWSEWKYVEAHNLSSSI